jgi:hypothetical protein
MDPTLKDAEVFVTDGYKEQQVLLKQLEMEEEQQEKRDGGEKQWTGFYGKLLDDTDRMNAAARNIDMSASGNGKDDNVAVDEEDKKTAGSQAKNLKGGLNVLKTSKTQRDRIKELQRTSGMQALKQAGGRQHMNAESRDRLTREFEKQMMEREERERKRQREEEEQRRVAFQRQTDDAQLAEARRRAAERRKARQQQQQQQEKQDD